MMIVVINCLLTINVEVEWPVQYLTLSLLIGSPSIIITALLKITTNQIGGVDIPITVFFSLAATFLFAIATKGEIQLIRALVSPLVSDDVARNFIGRVRFAYYSSTLIFVITIFTLNFLPIAYPSIYNGTNVYPRAMIVIGKNVTAVLYLTAITITYKMTTIEAERLLERTGNSERKANAVDNVIRKLNEEHKASMKKLFVGIIIYGVFCIPQLWGYATVPFAFLITIASGKGVSYYFIHCINIYIYKIVEMWRCSPKK